MHGRAQPKHFRTWGAYNDALDRLDRFRVNGGNHSIPEHAPPLVKKLFQIMNEERATLHEVADRAGTSRHTIGNWRTRTAPSLLLFEAVLNTLGYRLVIVRENWKPRGKGK